MVWCLETGFYKEPISFQTASYGQCLEASAKVLSPEASPPDLELLLGVFFHYLLQS